MVDKKLLAALLIILAASPMFAKKKKDHKYAIKGAGGQVMASGTFKDGVEFPEAAPDSGLAADSPSEETVSAAADSPSEETVSAAADSPSEEPVPDSDTSRYTISAIEAPDNGLNYYVTKDENQEFHFVQKLSWNKIEDIKNYRITIQRKQDDGTWLDVLQKDLFENKIEVSLGAGSYRFHVGVVNLFDQLEKNSAWKFFEVLKATQPKIDAMQTESLVLNSKKADGIFTLGGENLTPNTIFTMEQKNSEPPKIIQGNILSVSPDGTSAQVKFDLQEISEGKYEIYAQNPGGLSVISKTITIKNKKDRFWRFLVSAGYTFPMTFFDGTFDKYTGNSFYPISGTAKMELISFHTKAGDFGFGAVGNFSMFSNETDKVSMSGKYANALACLVWQKYIVPQKLCIDVHVGAGAALLFDVGFKNKVVGSDSPNMQSLALAFGGGLGIQYHVAKHFYIEGNVDFVDAKFSDMNLGMLYPSLSVGGMF